MSVYKSEEKMKIKRRLKELQKAGEAPAWMKWFSLAMLEEGYLDNGETPRSKYRRIARAAAQYLPEDQDSWEDKFFDLIWNNWLSPSTPVLGNLGTDKGMSVSCSASIVNDTMWDIAYTNYEISMLSSQGFGTAAFLNVRGGNSPISTGGTTNATRDWVEMFWNTQNKINQGALRRGSTAIYLDFWHSDLRDILPMLETHDRLHIGVVCDDTVKKALEENDSKAISIYRDILTWRARKGKPYIIFIDNARRQDPEMYKALGLSTKHSNLCLAGDQRVVTDRGYLTAEELYKQGGDLVLFDGEKPVEASAMKLREHTKELLEIILSNGMTHKVTSYHKVIVQNDSSKDPIQKEARDLTVGDSLCVQINKGLFGTTDMKDEAFLLGLYQADGTQFKNKRMIDVWEKDFDLIPEIEEKIHKLQKKYNHTSCLITHRSGTVFSKPINEMHFTECVVAQSDVRKKRISTTMFEKIGGFEKGLVPDWIWNAKEETLWQYVRGLLYADGTVSVSESKDSPIQLSLANISFNFLKQIQLIFNNLGIASSIRLLRTGGIALMPDGRGGYKNYKTKDCFRLIVGSKKSCLEIEKKTGFLSRKEIDIEDREYRDNTKKRAKIVAINKLIVNEPVYCPTVYNDAHVFVSNGIHTVNCSEIFLHTDSEHTLSCVLSSMCGHTFDEWKDTDAVFNATVFLDCIAQDLIVRGRKIQGLERVVASTIKGRALGLGLLGFHSYLQQKMIPFDDLRARYHNRIIFKHLQEESLRASKFLATWLGEPEWCKGTGLRNSHRLAVAPNTSSAFFSGGQSQGIEPLVANVFTQKLSKVGAVDRMPAQLVKILKDKSKYSDETINAIVSDKGSVQKLEFLTAEEKAVFKTAYEINQKVIIDLAEQRQAYICQGQSLNLFFDANEDEAWIHEVHKYAFNQKALKSLYYVRTMAGISADKDGACLACEG